MASRKKKTPTEQIRYKARRFTEELERHKMPFFCLWFLPNNPPTADFQFRVQDPRQLAAVIRLVAKQDKALETVLGHLFAQMEAERDAAMQEQQKQQPKSKLILK